MKYYIVFLILIQFCVLNYSAYSQAILNKVLTGNINLTNKSKEQKDKTQVEIDFLNSDIAKLENYTNGKSDKEIANNSYNIQTVLSNAYNRIHKINNIDPKYDVSAYKTKLDGYSNTNNKASENEKKAAKLDKPDLNSNSDVDLKNGEVLYKGEKKLTYKEDSFEKGKKFHFYNLSGIEIISADTTYNPRLKRYKTDVYYPTLKQHADIGILLSINEVLKEHFMTNVISVTGDINLKNLKKQFYVYQIMPDDNSKATTIDVNTIKLLRMPNDFYKGKIDKTGKVFDDLDDYIGKVDLASGKVYDKAQELMGRISSNGYIYNAGDKYVGRIGTNSWTFFNKYDEEIGYMYENYVCGPKESSPTTNSTGKLVTGFKYNVYYLGTIIYFFNFYGLYYDNE